MLKFNNYKFLIIILSCILTNQIFESMNYNGKNTYSENFSLKTSEVSGKINVNGNSGWNTLKSSGKCTGSGTISNPYVIEDLVIDALDSGSCITIQGSDVYFRIENCTLYNSGSEWGDSGIKLMNTKNGQIIDCTLSYNDFSGFQLEDCEKIEIVNNDLNHNNEYGIAFWYSHNNVITNNTVNAGDWGISLESSNNNEILGIEVTNHASSGIGIWNSKNNKIIDCRVLTNYYGLYIYRSERNLIQDSFIAGNFVGVVLDDSPCTMLVDNHLGSNVNSIWGEYNDCPPEVPSLSPLVIIVIIVSVIIISAIGFIVLRKIMKSKAKRIEKKSIEEDHVLAHIDLKKASVEEKKPQIIPIIEMNEDIHPEIKKSVTIAYDLQPNEVIEEEKKPTDVIIPPVSPIQSIRELDKDKITEYSVQKPILEKIPQEIEKEKLEGETERKQEELFPIVSELEEKELSEESLKLFTPKHSERSEQISISSERKGEAVINEHIHHFCTNCGKLLVNTWKICAFCGVKIRKELWTEILKPEKEKEEAISTSKSQEAPTIKPRIESDISLLKEAFTQFEPISGEELRILTKDKAEIEQAEPNSSIELKTKVVDEDVLVSSQDLSSVEKFVEPFAIKSPSIEDQIFTKKKIVQPIVTKNVCPFCGYTNELEKTHCYQCGYKLNK